MRTWAASLLVAVLASCGGAEQAAPEPAEDFPVTTPVEGAALEHEYVGQIQAVRYVELRARTRGVLEGVAVDEGQRVRAGQELFSLGVRSLERELERARAGVATVAAELRAAEVELNGTKLLFEKKVVSNAELELSRARTDVIGARLREAQALEGQARLGVSYGRVQAPFAGVVNRLPKKLGSLVAEDDLLTTLADTSEVFVYFRVGEREYLEHAKRLEKGTVSLVLPDGTRYAKPGVVDAVESEFDRATGNIAFRARFPNEDGLLKHGGTGRVVLREELRDALVVPQRSTFEIQELLHVFRVDERGVVHATRVKPRARTKDAFVLAGGLEPGDRFVLEGTQRLRDGQRINARPVGPTGAPEGR